MTVGGTLIVTVNVAVGSSFPAHATASAFISATTVPSTTTNPTYSSGGVGLGAVVRAGARGATRISIPYAFTVGALTDAVLLVTTLTTSTGEYASVTQKNPLPANGATTNVTVSQKIGG